MTSEPVDDGCWRIARRLRYDRRTRIRDGLPQFGFHVGADDVFIVEYASGYIGLIRDGHVQWTAGARDPGLANRHIDVHLVEPRFVGEGDAPGVVFATDAQAIWRVDVEQADFEIVATASDVELADPGNAIWIEGSGIWVNDIVGHQILGLTLDGNPFERIGDGATGFQREQVPFSEARFGQIYDMRSGPDGHLYVLDSTNYAVRIVSIGGGYVETLCGDGVPGWSGDGGSAIDARLGGDPEADFDGPWSLAVDDQRNVFIGDTHNHAIRCIDAQTGHISTIAHSGTAELPDNDSEDAGRGNDPFVLICGMDLDRERRRLLIPDWVSEQEDELIVLEKR